jgi:lipopolysaccharide transport system permease protein
VEIVIDGKRGERHYWRDLWRYRELLLFLAWRDVLVRYKQTAVGVAWSVIRPVLTMIAFTLIFGRIARLPSEGVPYAVLVFAAMLPWYFFATALAEGSSSLTQNANIVSKVYFPRLIVPVSTLAVSLVDLVISLLIFAGLLAWYGIPLTAKVLALPGLLVLLVAATAGLTIWLAALNVRYRDFRYVVPFVVQVGLFLSPVGFGLAVVPEAWRAAYALNPMVGIIEGFRWALIDGYPLDTGSLAIGCAMSALLLWLGLAYFRRTERSIADVI